MQGSLLAGLDHFLWPHHLESDDKPEGSDDEIINVADDGDEVGNEIDEADSVSHNEGGECPCMPGDTQSSVGKR